VSTREHAEEDERLHAFLMSPLAIRECAEAMYAQVLGGHSLHWTVDEGRLGAVAERVARVTRAAYPDVRRVPPHGRMRHFDAGGVGRNASFAALIGGADPDEQLRARVEVVITSVLLDAGAGAAWTFVGEDGRTYGRSEGLAVASYEWFVRGGFSTDGKRPRADAAALKGMDGPALSRAFRVEATNPLVGVQGRVDLLRRLGAAVGAKPLYFGSSGRLGELGVTLKRAAREGALKAAAVFAAVQDALGSIWPGRLSIAEKNLGDVWVHGTYGYVPFHKLAQWLTYSLCEPLMLAGVRVTDLDELTGLAEYRNGGLFVDAGVLVPKDEDELAARHLVSSDFVVEWRALTLALLDRTVANLRALLGVSAEELPLASALEGGTWSAGREIARERRLDGGPPFAIESDGTVF
jgi:hypothetical protein